MSAAKRSAAGGGAAEAGAADRGRTRRARAAQRRAQHRIPVPLLVGSALLAAAAVAFGVLAAWPIYRTPLLWLVAGVGGTIAFLIVLAGSRWRWGALTVVALLAAFVVLVVPMGVPQALQTGPAGVLRGLGDGLAAVALGWKQLLTLTLPVGTYQTVLVPFLVTIVASVAAATALALRGGLAAAAAAIPFVGPVLFGTVFGSSVVSDPLALGPFTIAAPRELGLWLGAFGVAAVWIAWSSGIERRAALRRGRMASATGTDDLTVAGGRRTGTGAVRRNAVVRGLIAGTTVIAALAAGLALAPRLDGTTRTVPRDRIDPQIVVRDQVSPLAAYRGWKRDDTLDAPLFGVSAAGNGASGDAALPSRLRLAVLDEYDGVDFFVGEGRDSGRFTRFPSGERPEHAARVTVRIESGYRDIWVPIAPPLGGPPDFAGARATRLSDSFYLNGNSGSAVAVPTANGLREGDGYTATMDAAPDAVVDARPSSEQPLVDLDTVPQLARWLKTQELPADGEGLALAIERLRERGYLSHSLTNGAGEGAWLEELSREAPIRFVSSPGGHSLSRIEQLFQQLNEQEAAAGEQAPEKMLVAGIGDDEQFATAAALIARAMGYESRVVVGVRLDGSGAGEAAAGVPGVPACAESCTGANIAAWIEVRGAGGVWAPLDVSPQFEVPPTMLEKGEQLPEFPTQPEERDATESDPPVGMSDQDSGSGNEGDRPGFDALWPVLRGIGLGLGALVLLLLPILFLPIAKRVRDRRRRSEQQPELRTLAAWDRLVDDYADSGTPPPEGSRREQAEAFGIDAGDWIAWTVDRAVYSREGVSPEEAEQLVQVVDAELATRREQRGFWARVRHRYSLRSLGPFAGRAGARSRRQRSQRRSQRGGAR